LLEDSRDLITGNARVVILPLAMLMYNVGDFALRVTYEFEEAHQPESLSVRWTEVHEDVVDLKLLLDREDSVKIKNIGSPLRDSLFHNFSRHFLHQ